MAQEDNLCLSLRVTPKTQVHFLQPLNQARRGDFIPPFNLNENVSMRAFTYRQRQNKRLKNCPLRQKPTRT